MSVRTLSQEHGESVAGSFAMHPMLLKMASTSMWSISSAWITRTTSSGGSALVGSAQDRRRSPEPCACACRPKGIDQGVAPSAGFALTVL
ncbi:hypothetical protein AK812_SmicGene26655 [Symbiodinium microadriaticum]|uniref:Uncharacterized protein n=1 Tax=Symbiodinium microadriaticum TaxID=2951 RepID=A0A1Q9D8W7_SYMMI|nr:hypothetical protein AK812_SmicGene26655 [Symbiodinium microadriaticum]